MYDWSSEWNGYSQATSRPSEYVPYRSRVQVGHSEDSWACYGIHNRPAISSREPSSI
jgi:hypothetical protein